MAQTFYTIPPGPPLIEHFAILRLVGQIVVYEFMGAKEWYTRQPLAEELRGNYFTTTYHCEFVWSGRQFSQVEAYDWIKKFYHPHEV